MAEMVMTLFTAVAGAAPAASTAAAATAGATAGGLSVLHGVTTAGSMLASLTGGVMAFGEGQAQSSLARMQAEQEMLASKDQALRIKSEFLQKSAAARVAFAGSGVDAASGTPAAVEAGMRGEADYEIGTANLNGQLRAASARMRANQLSLKSFGDLAGGIFKAASAYGQYAIDSKRRGLDIARTEPEV